MLWQRRLCQLRALPKLMEAPTEMGLLLMHALLIVTFENAVCMPRARWRWGIEKSATLLRSRTNT